MLARMQHPGYPKCPSYLSGRRPQQIGEPQSLVYGSVCTLSTRDDSVPVGSSSFEGVGTYK